MTSILISAPYMLPTLERFRPVFAHFGLDIIPATANERLSEEELLVYAGAVDGVICGDDRFSRAVLAAYAPRLKVISKWGTGIDSIDQEAAASLGIRNPPTPRNEFDNPIIRLQLRAAFCWSKWALARRPTPPSFIFVFTMNAASCCTVTRHSARPLFRTPSLQPDRVDRWQDQLVEFRLSSLPAVHKPARSPRYHAEIQQLWWCYSIAGTMRSA